MRSQFVTKKTAAPDAAWWWDGFMAFYAQPARPDITRALQKFTETLDDPSKAPTYKQVRTALGKLKDNGRR